VSPEIFSPDGMNLTIGRMVLSMIIGIGYLKIGVWKHAFLKNLRNVPGSGTNVNARETSLSSDFKEP
jgi:hypothetical protein